MNNTLLYVSIVVCSLFIVQTAASQVNSPSTFIHDNDSLLSVEVKDQLESKLSEFYKNYNVVVILEVENTRSITYRTFDQETKDRFLYIHNLGTNNYGDKTLNMFIYYVKDENTLRIAHSIVCSLESETILSIERSPEVSDTIAEGNYDEAFSNLVDKLITGIKNHIENAPICRIGHEIDIDCKDIWKTGPSYKKIDITFVGVYYSNLMDLENDANLAINSLLSSSLFYEQRDLFNFHMLTPINNEYSNLAFPNYNVIDDFIEHLRVYNRREKFRKTINDYCPTDVVVVLFRDDVIGNANFAKRTLGFITSPGFIIISTSKPYENVVVHEMGKWVMRFSI